MKYFILLAAIVAVGCTEDNPGFVPDPQLPGECRAGEEVDEVFESFESSKLYDILFVIDNSGDAQELQTVLADSVPAFLETFEAAEKNVVVAVTTTDPNMSDLAVPGEIAEGCAGNDKKIAESDDSDRWKEVAACNVVQETTEDRADAIFTTIQKSVLAGNNGLWRDRSRKLVVVVSRDDDCSSTEAITGEMPREACRTSESLTEVSSFVDFVASNPQTPEGLTIAFIAGPAVTEETDDRARPVCNSRIGPVYAGNRLQEAADGLGVQSLVQNVCSEDLTPALQSIAQHVLGRGTTLCASREMAHEPLRVVDGDDAEVRVGDGGFVYLGSQPECENGALVFDDDALEEIEVTYCAL